MRFRALKTRPKIFLAACPPIVLMIGLGGAVFYGIDSIVKTDRWVEHTHVVLDEASLITRSMVDMETGMRGYLLAGDARFLEPYHAGDKGTYKGIASLQERVADNPSQVARLDLVWDLVKLWQRDVAERMIALRGEIGHSKTMDDMALLVGEAQGRVYFDQIRALMAEFDAEERSLMALRQQANAETIEATYLLVLICTAIAIVAGVAASWLIGGDIAKPIVKVTRAVERLAAGEKETVLLEKGRGDELGSLADSFNAMAIKLAAKDDLVAAEAKVRLAAETKAKAAKVLLHERGVELEQRIFELETMSIDLAKENAERKTAEARLFEAIESMSEGFAIWASDDRLAMCNSKYLEGFRQLSDILVPGVRFEDFLRAAVERGVYDPGDVSVDNFIQNRLEEHRNPDGAFERRVGEERWLRISKRRTDSGGIVGTWTDITEWKKAEETIRDLAMSDPLTGLANRNRFHADMDQALASAKRQNYRVALLFLDLDKFKSVNDEFGHPTGDDLLKQVASRLVVTARETDTVARLGGDEFAIIMTQMDRADEPVQLASRMIESLSAPFHLGGDVVQTGGSIGISIYPDDDTDIDELIRKADVALYQAKAEGGGNYRLYDAVMHGATRAAQRIKRELRVAIDRDEFTLHYQPQIDISTNRITGAEALIRWQHPERGLLLPGEFISVAESSDLIVQIGQRVLQMACAQVSQWQAETQMPALRVAVNVSPRQFKSDMLVGLFEDTLRQTGIAAESLELEITEGTMMENFERANETLSRLKELGVSIAIDDFGTGYSSLARLKRFPVNRLKIDQSFVRGLTTDTDDAVIVEAIIQLGHNLRLTVIAEGVETDEQLAVLRDLGCDEAQGYLFSRPVPPEEFTSWVEARHKLRTLCPATAPA